MTTTPTMADAFNLLLQGSLALAEVEANGIKIDVDYLDKATAKVSRRIAKLQERLKTDSVWGTWQRKYRGKANLGSLAQLAEVLFKEMKLPYKADFTATGRYKADEETLATVDLPFVKRYMRLRKLSDLKAKSLDGLRREVVDGCFHPVFNLHLARTYRSSSGADKADDKATRDYNFQNIPIRSAEGAEIIRRSFIPREGRVLIETDYGQLEWKGAACVWKDPEMVAYASDPDKDIHRDEAVELFLCEREQVGKKLRYLAKNQFVFPQLYGSYFVKCAKNIWESLPGVTLADGKTKVFDWLASKGIDSLPKYERYVEKVEVAFLRRFPLFAAGKDKQWERYARKGKYSLLTGFQIEWGKAGPCSRNNLLNDPIQGPMSHCLLWSLIRVQKILRKRKMKSLIVGTIHDCILGDVPEEEVQEYLTLTERVMTEDIRKAWPWIIVPLIVENDVTPLGSSWHFKEPWIKNVDGTWIPKGKAA